MVCTGTLFCPKPHGTLVSCGTPVENLCLHPLHSYSRLLNALGIPWLEGWQYVDVHSTCQCHSACQPTAYVSNDCYTWQRVILLTGQISFALTASVWYDSGVHTSHLCTTVLPPGGLLHTLLASRWHSSDQTLVGCVS